MNEKKIKMFKATIKDVNVADYSLTAIVSTDSVDRYGDIVLPEAFKKRLKVYKDHPVLLSSHNYNKLTSQIGEAQNIRVTENGLEAKFKYYVGLGNEEADWAWVLATKGIGAFSVGFIGHEFEYIRENDTEGVERVTGVKFTDVELIEVSQVLVPANRDALQNGVETATEQLAMAELVSKSFEDLQKDFSALPKKEKEQPHYTDSILAETEKSKSQRKGVDADEVVKALHNTVNGILKKE